MTLAQVAHALNNPRPYEPMAQVGQGPIEPNGLRSPKAQGLQKIRVNKKEPLVPFLNKLFFEAKVQIKRTLQKSENIFSKFSNILSNKRRELWIG